MSRIFYLLLLLFTISILPAHAAGLTTSSQIDWGKLVMGLFGGLALFLYGMEMMSEGMKKCAGDKMRSILAALTKNRVIAMTVGAFVTTIIQSSSATTVMLVSFVQAGLMSFYQTLGVILGADIGTTITAQLVAFKLTDYALVMIAAGFCMRMFSKRDSIKHLGDAILGFGVLFFGMKLMSSSMAPLRTYSEFINVLKGLENPLLGVLVGTIFTALIQSSSAFTGIIIVLAQQNLITLDAGIPLVMGANIGTCITAALASIGAGRNAKRVAVAHALFKVAGVLLFIFWIPTFANLIRTLGAEFAVGTARNIANAHTVFNVSLALIFLPFTTLFGVLVMKILPDKKEEKGLVPAIWHLDEGVLSNPSIALELARSEISRMAKIIGRMVDSIPEMFLEDKNQHKIKDKVYPHLTVVEAIEMREEKLDYLEERVGKYLMKIGRRQLSESQMQEVYGLMTVIKDMESIGDLIQKNLIPQMSKNEALDATFSKEGQDEIRTYHEKIVQLINKLEDASVNADPKASRKIVQQSKSSIELESEYRIRHLERVRSKREESLKTHEIHMELMDSMKQINGYVINISKNLASVVTGKPQNDLNALS